MANAQVVTLINAVSLAYDYEPMPAPIGICLVMPNEDF